MTSFPIAFIYILGALLLLVLPGRVRSAVFLAIAALAFYFLANLETGAEFTIRFLSYDLMLTRIDGLSWTFAWVMVIMSFLGGVYSYHVKDRLQQVSALFYIGSSLGVIFAGDLLTVVIYWEVMAIASLMLIWARRTPESRKAGFRYLLVHAFGGSLLVGGVLLHFSQTGSMAFGLMEGGTASYLILAAFAVNAAIPPLNAWMPDAYPESTVTGTVFLSAFTSKVAVYALARGFAGEEILIWAGIVMALYGTVYALMQNDIRRLLAYSIIAQIGYMVTAIGVGTDAAINGASAHAFTHILYKGLLLMVAGTVLYSTGRSKLTELGGLARKMPVALAFYGIGALAISGMPLFSGYVSKTIITGALHEHHLDIAVLLLTVATFGTFLHTGLKLPYYTWFGQDREIKPSKVPVNQYIAMGLIAIPCIAIGVYPPLLTNILPYEVDTHIYTTSHVLEVLQLLILAGAAFWLLKGLLKGREKIVLDTDWFYRRPSRFAYNLFSVQVHNIFIFAGDIVNSIVGWVGRLSTNPPGTVLTTINNIGHVFSGRGMPEKNPSSYNPDSYRIPLGIMLAVIVTFFVIFLAWVVLTD